MAAGVSKGRRPVIVDTALLSFCYCLGMGAVFVSVSVVSLVVAERVSSGLALVPSALQKGVATFAAYPGARHKTRRGFFITSLLGSLGYAICALTVASVHDPVISFAVLCVGYCIAGVSEPFVQFLRFAASDIAPPEFKARAISYVIAGGSLAALAGPELANALVDTIPGRRYVGSYIGGSCLLLLQGLIVLVIDFSPVAANDEPKEVETREAAGDVEQSPEEVKVEVPQKEPGDRCAAAADQSLFSIVCRWRFALTASTAAIAQLTMISLMQMTPLSMGQAGLELVYAVRVIQGHILGMYLPSFCTGQVISFLGAYQTMRNGIFINLVAAFCLLSDTSSFWSYMVCLTMIGVGWNWGFVGATSVLDKAASAYSATDQAKAKGFNDFCIQLLGALGTACSGFLAAASGWQWLAIINASLLGAQLLLVVALPLVFRSAL